MRVLILSSGGKDSAYSIWWATLRGWDVAGIVTVRIKGKDSMMFQVPTTALAGLQSHSAGIAWLPVSINEENDAEMLELEAAIEGVIHGSRKPRSKTWSASDLDAADWPDSWPWPDGIKLLQPDYPIDAIIVGALRSDYQKTRIEQMCHRLGVLSYTPIWHHDPDQHMNELIDHGFEMMITSVTCDGLGQEWLGKILNDVNYMQLKDLSEEYRFNVDGEGGEYETAVVYTPWMNHRILTKQTIHWTGARGWVDIWSAELEDIAD